MRKLLIPIVAAASALAVAAPAAAQAWAPPGNNYQQNNYNNYRQDNYNPRSHELNFPRAMQARVERIRGEIRSMQERRMLSWREARSLEYQASRIQDRLWRDSRYGMQPDEARRIEAGINRLEYRVSSEANNWNNRRDYRGY